MRVHCVSTFKRWNYLGKQWQQPRKSFGAQDSRGVVCQTRHSSIAFLMRSFRSLPPGSNANHLHWPNNVFICRNLNCNFWVHPNVVIPGQNDCSIVYRTSSNVSRPWVEASLEEETSFSSLRSRRESRKPSNQNMMAVCYLTRKAMVGSLHLVSPTATVRFRLEATLLR